MTVRSGGREGQAYRGYVLERRGDDVRIRYYDEYLSVCASEEEARTIIDGWHNAR